MDFDISGSGYSIRPAGPGDAKALRMLLPAMPSAAVGLVAVDGQRQLVIGAAMATHAQRRAPLVGPGVAVHVIKPCRRMGIGKRLTARLALVAQSAGAGALYAAKRVEEGSDEEDAWRWLGFKPCETVERHRLSLPQLEAQLAPMIELMRERGRIPTDAQIVPLYRASLTDVAQLHLDNLGGEREDLERRLRGQGPRAFLPQHSRVLLIDGKVKGCVIGQQKDADTMVVDANIVDPSVRGTWANIWLRLATARGVAQLGIKNIEFTTFDHYGDTRSIAKKLGGVTTSRSVLMFRPLGGA
jgi:hypothetical protein